MNATDIDSLAAIEEIKRLKARYCRYIDTKQWGALPSLFSSVRIAHDYSVIGAIFGEYVGSSAGLGFYMQLKQHSFATAGVLAAIVVTALLSVALVASVALVERLALPWYYLPRQREGV